MTKPRKCLSSWRTSSYTNTNGNCVEIHGSLQAVRDTKDRRPMLLVDVSPLVRAVKAGGFDLPTIA